MIPPPIAEAEHMTRERVLAQHCLRLRRQAVKALAHVGHTRRQPHPSARGQPDHRSSSITWRKNRRRHLAAQAYPCAPAKLDLDDALAHTSAYVERFRVAGDRPVAAEPLRNPLVRSSQPRSADRTNAHMKSMARTPLGAAISGRPIILPVARGYACAGNTWIHERSSL
jgi:hypothetical protein